MKKFITLLVCLFSLEAKEVAHFHTHTSTKLKLNYEHREFSHSLKKEKGDLYGIEVDTKQQNHHLQLYYENVHTKTTPIVPSDLHIDKGAVVYTYKELYTLHYLYIHDNLIEEAKNASVIGLGIGKKLRFDLYYSLYENFRVTQGDISWNFQRKFTSVVLFGSVFGKAIFLDKRDSLFAKNAKNFYSPVGVKLHLHYKKLHFGVATIQGKRVFSVMHNGLQVQHHAMEFAYSYMAGVGYNITQNATLTLRYSYHKAKELPQNNDGVYINNTAVELQYSF